METLDIRALSPITVVVKFNVEKVPNSAKIDPADSVETIEEFAYTVIADSALINPTFAITLFVERVNIWNEETNK